MAGAALRAHGLYQRPVFIRLTLGLPSIALEKHDTLSDPRQPSQRAVRYTGEEEIKLR